MRKWNNVTLLSILVILLFQSVGASAIGQEYVATEYVKEAGVTIQFPEEVLSVTQDSLPTDSFFQIYGTDLYDTIIKQLKEDSIYLDAINEAATWELRVSADENTGINLKDISKDDAENIAKIIGNELEKKDTIVQETYAIMHSYSAILVIHCVYENQNVFLCMTSAKNKIITISISDIYIGSISINELKKLTDTIAEGIIFEEDNSASTGSAISLREQNVEIEEIGASFKLPAEMKWATRSKGDKKYIIENYNLDEKSFSSYLENNEYYFMSIDPNSSFRFDLIKTLAEAGIKNSVLLSDQELIDDMNSQEYADLLLLATYVDEWVWRDEKNAIQCLIMEFEDVEQYVLSATTAINGYFYIFSMRDTDVEHLRNTAEYIFSTFSVAQSNEQELMNVSLIGKQLKLPENWTITDQSTEYVEGIGMSDSVLIQAHTPDGTRRVTMITIMDSTSLLLENATKAER